MLRFIALKLKVCRESLSINVWTLDNCICDTLNIINVILNIIKNIIYNIRKSLSGIDKFYILVYK